VTRHRLVVIGTGGLGRETAWALQSADHPPELLGFVTCFEDQHGSQVSDLPVLGDESWLIGRPEVETVCCIGDPRARLRLVTKLAAEGVRFASVVHPSAIVSPEVEIGAGALIGARAVVTTQVTIGRYAVIGAGAIVSHDCRLEDFATLAPGVLLAGSVRVEYGAELGVGASVRPEQIIGRGALVGAGSAVVDAVEANTVVAGVPARPMKRFPADQQL
jgi:sugar O-acyltransferase (sialic acid O-acetyltransferase NeuD family)